MKIFLEERFSDSPFVERVWHSHSEGRGLITSIAASHWSIVIEKFQGVVKIYVRGPETRVSFGDYPDDAEWVGIVFKFGTFMPHLPNSTLVDGELNLPDATRKSFWLKGSAWQFPDYENVDTFVERLARQNVLVHEPVVAHILQGHPTHLSLRSEQRHFLRATGLSHSDARLIERARYATMLLQQGVPILDTAYQAGYFDQAHLTKSLRRFIGLTPAQIVDKNRSEQLSFLYKTGVFR